MKIQALILTSLGLTARAVQAYHDYGYDYGFDSLSLSMRDPEGDYEYDVGAELELALRDLEDQYDYDYDDSMLSLYAREAGRLDLGAIMRANRGLVGGGNPITKMNQCMEDQWQMYSQANLRTDKNMIPDADRKRMKDYCDNKFKLRMPKQ